MAGRVAISIDKHTAAVMRLAGSLERGHFAANQPVSDDTEANGLVLDNCHRIHLVRGRLDHAGEGSCGLCGKPDSATHFASLMFHDAKDRGLSGAGEYVYGTVLCPDCAAKVALHPACEAELQGRIWAECPRADI